MKLYELLDGVSLTGGSASQEMEISSISCDTRDIRPGALFVALPGGKTDGHLYIETALEQLRAWGTDCTGLGAKAGMLHPARWQGVQADWPEWFSQMPVEIQIEVKIR